MLIELLYDPFDEVRQVASEILDVLLDSELTHLGVPPSLPHGAACGDMPSIIAHLMGAISEMRKVSQSTGRASHAEGFAQLQRLVYRARKYCFYPYSQSSMYRVMEADAMQNVELATKDLRKAVEKNVLHGSLVSLKFVRRPL